jgi:hypothetical protein
LGAGSPGSRRSGLSRSAAKALGLKPAPRRGRRHAAAAFWLAPRLAFAWSGAVAALLTAVAVLPLSLAPTPEPVVPSFPRADEGGRSTLVPISAKPILVADPAVAPAPPVTAEDKTLVSSPAPPLAGVRRSVAQKTLPAVNAASRVPRYVADKSMAGNTAHRRRASLKSRPLRSTATAAAAPRRAHWRVETVERQKYGVLAPGWVVVEADPTAATEREQNGAIRGHAGYARHPHADSRSDP